METSRKIESAEAQIESTVTQPSVSANEEILLSERENQSADASRQEAFPALHQKGGGPRTERGKQVSKYNASKHGIFSQVTLLKSEPRAQFNSLLAGLRRYFQPEGTFEELLVDKLASIVWRHRRLLLDMEKGRSGLVEDVSDLRVPPLGLSLRYEASLERAFDRALNQLERLQRARKGQPPPPTLNVHLDVP